MTHEVIRKTPFEFHPEHRRKKIKHVQVSKLSEIFGAKLTTSVPEFQKYVETLLGLDSEITFNFVEGTVAINIPNIYETVPDWWARLRGYNFFYGEQPIIARVDQYIANPEAMVAPDPEFFVLYAYIKATEAADNLRTWDDVSESWAECYIDSDSIWSRVKDKWIEGYKSFKDNVDADLPDGFNFYNYGFDFEALFSEATHPECGVDTRYRLFTCFDDKARVETRLFILREGYWIVAPYTFFNMQIMETLEEIL